MTRYKLDKNQIKKEFQYGSERLNVVVLDSVSSTNDVAKQALRDSPDQLSLIVTNRQTAGRGRSGKSFYSELAHGLYFTLAFLPNTERIENMPLYTLLAAATLVETLEEVLPKPVWIKWVNDLFYEGKKVSGILSEMVSGIEGKRTPGIVVGIGLNIAGNFAETDEKVQSVAGTLFGEQTPSDFNQNVFLGAFLNHFYKNHLSFQEKGFMALYEKHLLGIGQEVNYTINREQKQGVIEGINASGHLLVRQPDQSVEVLYGQEVHFGSNQFVEE